MQFAAPQRLFVAIQLPDAVKASMERAQHELRAGLSGDFVRWSKPERFHLTLRFLGDVEADRTEELTRVLRRACEGFSTIELVAEGIGFFPGPRRPRVIWSGVRGAGGELIRLHEAVESAVADFTSEPAEARFAGHVTLGRIPRIAAAAARRLELLSLGMAARNFGRWTAAQAELVRSDNSERGARYTALAAFPFLARPAGSHTPLLT